MDNDDVNQQQGQVQQNPNLQPQQAYVGTPNAVQPAQPSQQLTPAPAINQQPASPGVNQQPVANQIYQTSSNQTTGPILSQGMNTPDPTAPKIDVVEPVVEEGDSQGDSAPQVTEGVKEDEKLNFKSGITEEDYKGKTIAEILKELGKLKQDQYAQIKYEIANRTGKEEDVLKEKGWVSDEDIVRAKAASYGIPFVDLSDIEIPRKTLTKLPFTIAQTHQAIAFEEGPDSVSVGMVDPLDIQRVSYIRNVLNKDIKTFFASPDDVEMVLDTKYAGKMEADVTEAVEEADEGIVEIKEGIRDIKEIEDTIASAPVARIVNMMLEYAVKFKASDIHIEPRDKRLIVRVRINGIMMERLQLPLSLVPPVVSRIKILSDLKIDEHRVPQDGRFQIRVDEKEADIRVSVMPTVHGEKVVMRLLEKGGDLMRLEDTGMRGVSYKRYRSALDITQGIILVTGPTGSGKTQTLASSLSILNRPDVNIVTLEDPVEIKIDGVNQIQINNDVGLTFSKGLRSVVRQDPDIIMVGEIRDEETAELAVQASLTGHLVLATLHTNSAAGALPRLLDMHVEPYLITSTVNIIVGQRLVRTLCDKCKEAYSPSQDVIKMLHKVLQGLKGFDMYSFNTSASGVSPAGQVSTLDTSKVPAAEVEKQKQARSSQEITLYRSKGCGRCNNTGYKGRTGIFESLKVSDKVSQLIMEHKSASNIEKQGIEEGMITMVQDGFLKALEGITTLEEVLRVQQK